MFLCEDTSADITVEVNFSLRVEHLTHDHVEQTGLAATVTSDESYSLSRHNGHIQMIKQDLISECLGEIADGEVGH
jgi:hypothetical protein